MAPAGCRGSTTSGEGRVWASGGLRQKNQFAFGGAGRNASRRSGAAANHNHASGPRQETFARVGEENADADHAKECRNDLDHHDGPLRPAATKRHGRPNSQKNSAGRRRFARRLMISGNNVTKRLDGVIGRADMHRKPMQPRRWRREHQRCGRNRRDHFRATKACSGEVAAGSPGRTVVRRLGHASNVELPGDPMVASTRKRSVAPERTAARGNRPAADDNHASGPRQETFAGVGDENADADHAEQRRNDLDHHNGPLLSAKTKRHGGPNSQKNSASRTCIVMQLVISGNRACRKHGKPPARLATGWQYPGAKPSRRRPGCRARHYQPDGGLYGNG